MLPPICGEFGIVKEPEIKFSDKGQAWAKIRVVAKDRVRDANGTWSDGDPCFIDVIVNQGADHLCESVTVGDSILVVGKLKQREYEVDGQKRQSYQISADAVGVSTRWGVAKTARMSGSEGNIDQAKIILGATEAPF